GEGDAVEDGRRGAGGRERLDVPGQQGVDAVLPGREGGGGDARAEALAEGEADDVLGGDAARLLVVVADGGRLGVIGVDEHAEAGRSERRRWQEDGRGRRREVRPGRGEVWGVGGARGIGAGGEAEGGAGEPAGEGETRTGRDR